MTLPPRLHALALAAGTLLLPAAACTQGPGAPPAPVEWRAVSSPDRASVDALVESADGTLLVGTRAGLFVSRDRGRSWGSRGSGGRSIMDLLPTREGTLLAGTYRQGILRSTDGGASWSGVGFERNVYVGALAQDARGRIYAAVRGSVGDAPTGVFRSDDDGRTWASAGLSDEAVYSLGLPAPDVVYAGTERGLFRSRDGGGTWERTGDLPSPAPVSAVVAFDGDLFASMGAPLLRIPGGGVARSRDGGLSWEATDGLPARSATHALAVRGGTLLAAVGDFARGGGTGVHRLAPDGRWVPAGLEGRWIQSLLATSGGLFAGGMESGVFRSEDGRSWARRSAGLRNWQAASLAAGNGDLYAATLAELFRSDDGGRAWSAFPMPDRAAPPTPWSMSVAAAGTLVLGGRGGVLVSEDRGESWDFRPIPEEDGEVFAVTLGPGGELYASVPGEAVHVSRTSGASWSRIDLPDVPVHAFFPTAGGVDFFTGQRGLWRRTAEDAWELVGEHRVWALSPCGEGLVAGTFGRGLLRSTDRGRTWRPTTEDVRAGAQQEGYLTFTSLACLPGDRLLAGTFWDGVLLSPDGGRTWRDVTGALRAPTVLDFAVTPSGQVFASTPAGVYVAVLADAPGGGAGREGGTRRGGDP